MQTTVGRLAIEEILPKGFLDDFPPEKPLGNKDVESILQRVAEEKPELYRDISGKILRLGAKASVETGSSFSLSDMEWPVKKSTIMDKVEAEERKIFFNPKLSQDDKEKQLIILYSKYSDMMPDISFDSGIKKGSNLAKMVASGARGNKSQLNSNVGADFLVVDQNHKPVPVGIKHSFAEGLSLPEYFAGGYGARSGTIDGKFAVRDAGFLCLSGDTLVLMGDYSEKKIKDIEIGDVVFGSDTNGNIRPVSVLNKFANGTRQVNRYAFRLGKSRSDVVIVDATPYHKVLSKRVAGRKINNKIQVLPLSAVSKSFRCQPIQSVDYIGGRNVPLAFIIGYLIGDGGLTSHSVNFACGDNKALEYLSSVAESSGLLVKKVREREDVEYTIQDPLKPHLISTGGIAGESSDIVKLLKELDLWGKQSYQKRLHTDIFNWDTQSCTEFCAGLFEADGCATYSNNSTIPIISFCTTSEDMVRGYSELLRFRFGIHSSGVRRVPAVKTTRNLYNKILGRNTAVRSNHDGWKFVINDRESVIKFCELFSGRGRKGDTLKTLCENISEPKRQDKFVYSYLWQEDLGEVETFDIEVDHPDHLFVLANGLIVSNSKQLGSVSMDMIVTESDCGTKNGIPVASSDKDNIGSVLGRSVGGYKEGTIITPKIFKDLQNSKVDQVVLRSPITCEASNGGICSHCAGIREKNRFPGIGENVGLSAASSFSEPLSQALLKSKHTAGVSNATGVTGFKGINAMFQVPDVYPNKATLTTKDGIVEKIEELPQGGSHVFINGVAHYVPPTTPIIVKAGDDIEAGDPISEGNSSPAEVTALKGIGQGRLHFIKDVKNIFADNGVTINRRNAEVVAKAAIDHIQVGDIDDTSSYLPEDIVRYGNFVKDYQPRETSYSSSPKQAIGKFLEKPALHYSVGTRITNSVANNLDKFGDKELLVNDEEPTFAPKMIRLMDAPSYNEDWMAQLGTSYVQKNLKKNVVEGTSFSDIHGKHPLPALAYGKEFGKPPVGTVGY